MGKRSRQRGRTAAGAAPAAVPTRMARVRVSDEVWADFAAAAAPGSLTSLLSALVEERVREHRRQQVVAGTVDDRELLAALERARVLHVDLTAVVGRLERRLDCRAAVTRDVYE